MASVCLFTQTALLGYKTWQWTGKGISYQEIWREKKDWEFESHAHCPFPNHNFLLLSCPLHPSAGKRIARYHNRKINPQDRRGRESKSVVASRKTRAGSVEGQSGRLTPNSHSPLRRFGIAPSGRLQRPMGTKLRGPRQFRVYDKITSVFSSVKRLRHTSLWFNKFVW